MIIFQSDNEFKEYIVIKYDDIKKNNIKDAILYISKLKNLNWAESKKNDIYKQLNIMYVIRFNNLKHK